ncbi:hypothetical protein [Streptomyces phaeofaciens]|nr:hypothetical protein [Streptomyces phaeofaciens]
MNLASESSLDAALEHEATRIALTGGTHDHQNALLAFLGKRQPCFEGR